jgi:hypothetical protein
MFVIANREDMQYVRGRLCVFMQLHIPSSNVLLLLFTQQFFTAQFIQHLMVER